MTIRTDGPARYESPEGAARETVEQVIHDSYLRLSSRRSLSEQEIIDLLFAGPHRIARHVAPVTVGNPLSFVRTLQRLYVPATLQAAVFARYVELEGSPWVGLCYQNGGAVSGRIPKIRGTCAYEIDGRQWRGHIAEQTDEMCSPIILVRAE